MIHYRDDRVTLHHGDALDVLRDLPDCSVDSVVTDPPYGLREYPRRMIEATLIAWLSGDRAYVPDGGSGGFMGRDWDKFVPPPAAWDECFRVLKPGGHLLAFAGTRTFDLMAMSIRLAGLTTDTSPQIRDSIAWLYGSGFPKSLDVSKAIDKRPGVQRHPEFAAHLTARREAAGLSRADVSERVVGTRTGACWNWEHHQFPEAKWWPALRDLLDLDEAKWGPVIAEAERQKIGERTTGIGTGNGSVRIMGDGNRDLTASATPDAERWQGWGTALKPAFEPVVVARKPLAAGTVAANVLTHGTGALNIDATRIGSPLDSGGSSAGGSTVCTCPSREDDRTNRTPSTSHREGSDDSPARRSGPLTSAPAGGPEGLPPQGSQDGYPSSPRSGGAPAREAAGGGQASPRPLPGAGTSPVRCASCGRNRLTPSMPYGHSTAPHVEREATRRGEASADRRYTDQGGTNFAPLPGIRGGSPSGRWPANVVLDEDMAGVLDEQSGITSSVGKPRPRGDSRAATQGATRGGASGGFNLGNDERTDHGDTGGASRFFYVARSRCVCGHLWDWHGPGKDCVGCDCAYFRTYSQLDDIDAPFLYQAKAPKRERPVVDGVAHPTVKPLALMRWLVRLVTPPGGTVLEPFAGSGTTVEACLMEGFQCIAVEKGEEYLPLILERIRRQAEPVEPVRRVDVAKAIAEQVAEQLDIFGEETA